MSCQVFNVTETDPEKCNQFDNGLIVGNTDFKDHYPTVNKQMSWATLEPLIRQAQKQYVEPYACCEIICCFVELDELTDEESRLFTCLKDTIAYYAMYHAFPLLNSTVSDMGVQESFSKEATSQPATLWRYKNSRGEIINYADFSLDSFLTGLNNLPEDSTIREKWLASSCYKKYENCLFPELCDFQECVDIKNSRRTFLAIQPHLTKAIKECIIPCICKDLYNELCKSIKDNSLSDIHKELVALIRPLVANHAMAIGLSSLRVNIDHNGISLCSSNDGINQKKEAHDKAIHELRCDFERSAQQCKADLIDFLNENVDHLPLYKESSCYNAPGENCTCFTSSQNNCGAVGIM